MVAEHPRFWARHPRLLEMWQKRHPNYASFTGNSSISGLGEDNTGMYVAAGLALLLFFTPVGKRLMKAFKGD